MMPAAPATHILEKISKNVPKINFLCPYLSTYTNWGSVIRQTVPLTQILVKVGKIAPKKKRLFAVFALTLLKIKTFAPLSSPECSALLRPCVQIYISW